ncbi:zinc finger BED domain-containing protein 4-like [Scylla paramamosain]|uniref:zinc finger BED domain-containing protein 4-like n=1 Tax=Scylla paramamosain TaxID=85552 RepID=UPI00308358A3
MAMTSFVAVTECTQISTLDSLVTALDAELVVAGKSMARALGNRCRAAHAILADVTKNVTKSKQNSLDQLSITLLSQDASPLLPKEMDKLLLRFIAGSLQPLSRVEDASFEALLNKAQPSYSSPSRKELSSKLLPSQTQQLQEHLNKKSSSVGYICVTPDLCTNRQIRSCTGITCHFNDNFQLQSTLLACTRFKGCHTAQKIHATFTEIITSFNLQTKILTIVTDSGTNVLKALVTLPGVDDADTNQDSEGEEEDDTFHIPDNNDNLLQLLPGHCRPRDKNATRWNTSNKMLRSLLNIDPAKLHQLNCPVKITKYELNLIKQVTDILTPSEVATLECQGENVVTSSKAIPCIRGLKAELEQPSQTHKSKVITTLKSSIKKTLKIYEDKAMFQLASLLHPRFNMDWCSPQQVMFITSLLESKVHDIKSTATEEKGSLQENKEAPTKKCRLFRFMTPSASTSSSLCTLTSTLSQVQSYLSQPTTEDDSDPLLFWEQNQSPLPQLAILALRYLCIPPSSAPDCPRTEKCECARRQGVEQPPARY